MTLSVADETLAILLTSNYFSIRIQPSIVRVYNANNMYYPVCVLREQGVYSILALNREVGRPSLL